MYLSGSVHGLICGVVGHIQVPKEGKKNPKLLFLYFLSWCGDVARRAHHDFLQVQLNIGEVLQQPSP